MHRRLVSLLSWVCVIGSGCASESSDDELGSSTAMETSSSTAMETSSEGEAPLECEGDMRCNPLDPNDCPEGELCIFFNTEFQCFAFTGDGSGVAGAPCDSATACNPGLACIQSVFFTSCAGDACCSPNCKVDAPNTCPNAALGETCEPWSLGEGADACYVDVGVCSTLP